MTNPVRAGIVTLPEAHGWSSFHRNARGKKDELITPHATYLSLGKSEAARLSAYQWLFREAVDDDDIATIRAHVNQGRALGSEAFINRVEAIMNRRVRLARPGRPSNKVL